jgi:5-methylcytosine-specific restriction protein A
MSPIMQLCSCGAIVKVKPCPDCKRKRQRRPNSQARGYGSRWRSLSEKARKIQPWCSRCGATTDLTTDHRDPATKGRYDLTLADVEVLCRFCNSSKGGKR